MNERPTRDEVLASIVPRSDQLNADDLLTGPVTVTITKVTRGDKEQPISVHIDGDHQPFKPCKTIRRVLIAVYSDDPSKWVGQQLTLYCDPDVKYAGVKVGGIRISHMTGIDKPRPFLLTKSRGHKAEVIIHPIVVLSPADQTYIAESTKTLTAAESLEELRGHRKVLETKSKAIRDALWPTYATRMAELKQTDTTVPE